MGEDEDCYVEGLNGGYCWFLGKYEHKSGLKWVIFLVMKIMKGSISRSPRAVPVPPSPSRNACPERLREYPESEC
jgi:hypothetical protein